LSLFIKASWKKIDLNASLEKLYDSYGVIDLLYIELLWDPG